MDIAVSREANQNQNIGKKIDISKPDSSSGVSTCKPNKNFTVNDQQQINEHKNEDTALQDRLSIEVVTTLISKVAKGCSDTFWGFLGYEADNEHNLLGAYHYTTEDIPHQTNKVYNREITEFIEKVGGAIKTYPSGKNDIQDSKKTNYSSIGNYIDVFMLMKLEMILQNETTLKEQPESLQLENPEEVRNKFIQFIKQDDIYDFIENTKYCSDNCKKIAKEIRDVNPSDIKQIDNIQALLKEINKLRHTQ